MSLKRKADAKRWDEWEVGDRVAYFKEGHRPHKEFPDEAELPLGEKIHCIVTEKSVNRGKVRVGLQPDGGNIFTVLYNANAKLPEFLVLEEAYQESMEAGWEANSVFQAEFDGKMYKGQVAKRLAVSSGWECLQVKWFNENTGAYETNSDFKKVSPWELERADEERKRPAKKPRREVDESEDQERLEKEREREKQAKERERRRAEIEAREAAAAETKRAREAEKLAVEQLLADNKAKEAARKAAEETRLREIEEARRRKEDAEKKRREGEAAAAQLEAERLAELDRQRQVEEAEKQRVLDEERKKREEEERIRQEEDKQRRAAAAEANRLQVQAMIAQRREEEMKKKAEEEAKRASYKYSVAVICASNMNRSMEAHTVFKAKGLNVFSYGTGSQVKIPGASKDDPNMYEFGKQTYKEIYEDLIQKDKSLYTRNGLLNMLERNITVKARPEKFQECGLQFDIIVCFEERVFESVLEHLNSTGNQTLKAVQVFNLEVKDNHESAMIGARDALQLVLKLQELPNLEDDVHEAVERFRETTGKEVLHTVAFY